MFPKYEELGPIRLDSIILIVDAEQVFAFTEETSIEYPKLGQIGFSDMVIRKGVDPVDEYNYKK